MMKLHLNLIPPDYISMNKWLQQGCTVATIGQYAKNMACPKNDNFLPTYCMYLFFCAYTYALNMQIATSACTP